MATFSNVFTSVPQLQALDDNQKIRLLDQVYDKVKSSESVSNEVLRKYRDAQVQTLYDLDVSSGKVPSNVQRDDWEKAYQGQITNRDMLAGMTGVPEEPIVVDPVKKEALNRVFSRNLREDLRDMGDVATDFSHYPKALAKFGSDIFGLAGDYVGAPAAAAIHNLLNPDAKVSSAQLRQRTPVQESAQAAVNKWYEDAIKDDPELYRMYDAALTDATIGALFGLARGPAIAGQAIAEGATAGAAKRAGARAFMAPVVSNVVGGQFIYHGLEGVDQALENLDLSDRMKAGIRVGALALGAIGSGLTVERYLENVIQGGGRVTQAANALADSAQRVRETGKTFKEDLAENPELSESFKTILGLEDTTKFDPTAAADEVDTLMSADAKLRSGEELSSLEAAKLKERASPRLAQEVDVADAGVAQIGGDVLSRGRKRRFSPEQAAKKYPLPVLNQRAIGFIDQLTQEGRRLQTQLKSATEVGDTLAMQSIESKIAKVKELVEDTNATLAIANEGSQSLIKAVDEEIAQVRQSLQDITKKGLQAHGEERQALRASYRETQEKLGVLRDRRIALGRIPKEMKAKVTKPAASAEPSTSTSQATPLSFTSIESRLGSLAEPEKLSVQQVADSVISGKESILGRTLSEEERLDTLSKVLDNPSARQRVFEPSETPIKDGLINAGYAEERFPLATRALQVLSPETTQTGQFSSDSILALVQGVVARSGMGMAQPEYERAREVLREAFSLWDEVRDSMPKAEGADLSTFLLENSKTLRITKKQASAIASSLQEALPEMGMAIRADRVLPKGVSGLADSLTRLIEVGLDQTNLQELTHELGHLFFYYGLTGEQRLGWLDQMRTAARDEASWAQSFPGYSERVAALNSSGLDWESASKEAFWLNNPAEMFAQQVGEFLISNKLPSLETLESLNRVQKSIKSLLTQSAKNFESLPEDTKRFILKSFASPSVEDVRKVPDKVIKEHLESSWLFSDRETALVRVEETSRYLDEVYSGRTVGLEGMSEEQLDKMSLAAQNVAVTPQVSFLDLPVMTRVGMYSLADLPKVAELQSLRLLYDLPGADVDELQGVLKRLNHSLSDVNRPELIEGMVGSRLAQASKFDPNFDPAAGQYYSQGELRQMRREEETLLYNRLSPEARSLVSNDEAGRARRRVAQAREVADRIILEESSKGKTFTKEQKAALVDRILRGESPQDAVEGRIRGEATDEFIEDTYHDRWQSARNAVVQELAALDVEVEELKQFSNNVLAMKGLVSPIDPSFSERLSRAETFSRIVSGEDKSIRREHLWWSLARAGYVGAAGLEYDPNGVYIPGLGTVTWNPLTFLKNPLGALLIPGVPTAIRKGGSALVGGASKYSHVIPSSLRERISRTTKAVARMFGPNMGLSKELITTVGQARVFASSRKQEWYTFAETLQQHFTPRERQTIARIAEEGPGYNGLVRYASEHRPDVLAAAGMVRNLYDNIEKEFSKLGVWSEKFGQLSGKYVNRYYANLGRKQLKAIFQSQDVSPIRADFLKHKGVPYTLKNTRSNRELAFLSEQAELNGVELQEGLKLNLYETLDGQKIWSIPDTEFDYAAQKSYSKVHTWDSLYGGYVVEEVTPRGLKLRRDFTRDERQIMGEVSDISVRAAAMGERLERDYQRAFLYDKLSKTSMVVDPEAQVQGVQGLPGKYTRDVATAYAETNGWVSVPFDIDKETGIRKYGSLAGKWVHPEAWQAILATEPGMFSKWISSPTGQQSALGQAIKAHQAALRTWKITRTALSPAANLNNFVSNISMGFMLGHNPVMELKEGYEIMRVRSLILRSRNLLKQGSPAEAVRLLDEAMKSPSYGVYQEIREARMSDSSMWSSEIDASSLADALSQRVKAGDETDGFFQALAHGTADVLKNALGKAGKVYESGDLIFKMGAFSQARKAGMSASEALEYAYEAYFDYSQLAPGVRLLRDSGVIPFVSYMYKAIPAIGKAVTRNPGRVATVALALEALHLASINAVYGEEEPIAMREALDLAQPKYLQTRGLGGLFRTRLLVGGSQEETISGQSVNTAQYLDISRMLPGSDLWETSTTDINNIDFSLLAAGELLGSMLNQSPIISQAMQALTKKNPALGTSIAPEGDIGAPQDSEYIRGEFLKSVWNSAAPNLAFIPYTYTNEAFIEGLMGSGIIQEWPTWAPGGGKTGYDSVGLVKPLSSAIASQFGIKIRRVLPEKSLEVAGQSEQFGLNKSQARLRGILKSPRYSEEEKQQERENFLGKAEWVRERQERRAEMMGRLRAAHQRGQGGRTLPH